MTKEEFNDVRNFLAHQVDALTMISKNDRALIVNEIQSFRYVDYMSNPEKGFWEYVPRSRYS